MRLKSQEEAIQANIFRRPASLSRRNSRLSSRPRTPRKGFNLRVAPRANLKRRDFHISSSRIATAPRYVPRALTGTASSSEPGIILNWSQGRKVQGVERGSWSLGALGNFRPHSYPADMILLARRAIGRNV